ncbi:hypothetical protein AB0D71_21280 [Streptomyces avermitilis]|uniref:hypothetical protein n=1 Tax=Streptomyces avermitilis TaxID=33903 RepID=UPI0033D0F7F2
MEFTNTLRGRRHRSGSNKAARAEQPGRSSHVRRGLQSPPGGDGRLEVLVGRAAVVLVEGARVGGSVRGTLAAALSLARLLRPWLLVIRLPHSRARPHNPMRAMKSSMLKAQRLYGRSS